jgi:hypothetical protein
VEVHKLIRSFKTPQKSKHSNVEDKEAQDDIIQTSKNLENVDRDTLIPTDVNKTEGLPKELTIFVGAKVMLRSRLRYNADTEKGLVNRAIGEVVEKI